MTDDEALVALIDNELDETTRRDLLARLAQDEALRGRLEALQQSRAQIVAAYDSLLDQAPLARLRVSLPPGSRSRNAARRIEHWHAALAAAPKLTRSSRFAKDRRETAIDAKDVDAVRARRATANRTLTVLRGLSARPTRR